MTRWNRSVAREVAPEAAELYPDAAVLAPEHREEHDDYCTCAESDALVASGQMSWMEAHTRDWPGLR